jgi:hypothetical protein
MISKIKSTNVLSLCVFIALLSTGCGGRNGAITESISGAKSGQPLANTQIILCQGSQEISGCTLLSEPTTKSDANGAFTLENVTPGSYVLLYAMPDELISSPAEWEGLVVGPAEVEEDEDGKFVQVGKGKFWEEGWQNKGDYYTDDAGRRIYTDGYALSNSLGISMMVINQEREPLVVVPPRETIEFMWQVLER